MIEVDTDDAISALLRLDFAFFLRFAFRELGGEGEYLDNWHIDAIVHQLNRIRDGHNRRLLVTIPPRHLKSRTATIAWVAWMLGHSPALRFLCVSYGQDLAEDHARDCLKVMESGGTGGRSRASSSPAAALQTSARQPVAAVSRHRSMASPPGSEQTSSSSMTR
jgi:hypothetical protein